MTDELINESLTISLSHGLRALTNGKLTKRQRIILSIFIIGNFCVAACVSIQAPFFPERSAEKGVTSLVCGIIFSVYELSIIIFSPVVGYMVTRTSPNFLIEAGLFVTGSMTILFGLIDYIDDLKIFTWYAFILRIFEGIGAVSFLATNYTIMAVEFPNEVSFIFSLLETFFGLGLIIGPAAGGIMFTLGDYPTPFVVLGASMVLSSGAAFFFLPDFRSEKQLKPVPLSSFLGDIGTLLDTFSIITCLFLIGFNACTLQSQLLTFGLTELYIGLVFVINGVLYFTCGPLLGKICEIDSVNPRWINITGSLFNVIGVIFLGPLPYIPLESQLYYMLLALTFTGFGCSMKLVSAYSSMVQDAVGRRGYPRDTTTFSRISVIYHSSTSIGALFGPLVGGYMVGVVGYRWATSVLFILDILVFITQISYAILGPKRLDDNYTVL